MAYQAIPYRGFGAVIICTVAALLATSRASRAVETQPKSASNPSAIARAFTLEDQHKTVHDYRFPRAKVSVLIFADYKGSAQLESWIRPLYQRYRDAIAIDGVAELSSVPKLIRGMVRAAFRDRLDYPVMLDWSGEVSTDYRYQKGNANLFVIDHHWHILLKVIGAIDDSKMQRVQDVINRQLKGASP